MKVSYRVCKQMFFLATNDQLSFSHSLSSAFECGEEEEEDEKQEEEEEEEEDEEGE